MKSCSYLFLVSCFLFIVLSMGGFIFLNLFGPSIIEKKDRISVNTIDIDRKKLEILEYYKQYSLMNFQEQYPILLECKSDDKRCSTSWDFTNYICIVKYSFVDHSTWVLTPNESFWDRFHNNTIVYMVWISMLFLIITVLKYSCLYIAVKK